MIRRIGPMMWIIFAILGCLTLVWIVSFYFHSNEKPEGTVSRRSIYEYTITTLDGKSLPLRTLRGKKILIVNVASKCGFTPQYEELERLSKTFAPMLAVIGFPANDFMGQEPGTNDEIARFCSTTYGVTFPIAIKSSVKGEEKNELFRWLTDKSFNGWNDREPTWNFCKYLINEEGELIATFPPTTKPMSNDITSMLSQ